MTEEFIKVYSSQDSKIEQSLQFVDQIVEKYHSAEPNTAGHPIARDLAAYKDWLAEAHAFFRDASRQELTLSNTSEWVLDNYYVIRQSLRLIDEDLPPGYYRQLPKLTNGALMGFPRIYAITRDILTRQNLLMNMGDLQSLLVQVQERVPLTMGELWAIPIFLRYGLIEALAHTLAQILATQIQPQTAIRLPSTGPSADEKINFDKNGKPAEPERQGGNAAANIILSLRAISEQDWNNFFDSTSRVEQILQQDPAGIYSQMDFNSRDLYRKAIEHYAFATGRNENDLAEIALELAQAALKVNGREGTLSDRRVHNGYYLVAEGRPNFEARINYHPSGWKAIQQMAHRHASGFYLGGIALLTALLMILFLLPLRAGISQGWIVIVMGILLLLPALTMATSLVNWVVTMIKAPSVLPKLEFRDAATMPFRTLVVVPALLTEPDEVDSLARQMEMHYMRNSDPGLFFALLTDFGDADQETLPEDAALIQQANERIQALNDLYAQGKNEPLFFFLHRPRVWNAKEGKWMGWERKRGKLHALNQLILGINGKHEFLTQTGNIDPLRGVNFVITLDADTVLPRGGARRMVGTLAHPLNRALFDEKTGRVIAGYTILQPRMEISANSANHSWFTRIFSGDTGLDLYSRAVSDAYQDLFGEGSYVGKGIYDVAAFERSVAGHVPENTLLSHDLLEGLMGRAGLVTDITMVEDYPPNYFAQVYRQRRWVRGDWQLLPWLLFPNRFGVKFSAVDRWKIIDNLRRSLLAPGLALMLAAGVFLAPGLAWLWTAILLLGYGIPLLTSLARGVQRIIGGEVSSNAFHAVRFDLLRWILAVAFLPYEAYEATDAILTTLNRLLITHRHLLQWTTAAHVVQMFGISERRSLAWEKMGVASFLALGFGGLAAWIHPPAFWAISPVLLLWLFSPWIVRWINRPITQGKRVIAPDQVALFRRVSRRTWSFFERFVGPEDHWLPPDHFQESPLGITAHRTSPTNIGLLLNSTLAAYDLGYLDSLGVLTRLRATIDTMSQLERHRGHFINWYDTLTLQPLTPRYISTVDSGNLAASLIVTAQACKTMPSEPVFRWALWQGHLDTLSTLQETLAGLHRSAEKKDQVNPTKRFGVDREATRPLDMVRRVAALEEQIEDMSAKILSVRDDPEQWYGLFETVSGPFWEDVSRQLTILVVSGRAMFDLDSLHGLQDVSAQVAHNHLAVQRTITELVPWIPLLEEKPALFQSPRFKTEFEELGQTLIYNPSVDQITALVAKAYDQILHLRTEINGDQNLHAEGEMPAVDQPEERQKALAWLDAIDQAVTHAASTAATLLNGFAYITAASDQFVQEMEFQFLYNPLRQIFHIGYNLDAGQLDNNYYDLLASEARIASLVTIGRGEIPQSHWLHMSRPVTEVEGRRVLLSWSATMFEYLMPPLFLPSYPNTLLSESAYGAVQHQIAYGKSKGLPWGISESGFYQFDNNQSYQYRAFGVPGLGFKRGLGDDLVIAPYASLMAVGYDPQAVAQNIPELVKYGGLGLWGFYEAIDFTADRMLFGEPSAVVKEYMSHHQGMILLAMDNFLNHDIMVHRMMSDPRMASVDLLLQEQVPLTSQIQSPYTEDVKGTQRVAAPHAEIVQAWTLPVQTPIPQVNLLSNGNYSVLTSNASGGYSTWRGTDLTRWQPDGVLDPWGTWIYIQDIDLPVESRENLWSAGFQPVKGNPNESQVTYFPHMAVFRRNQNGIISTLEVTVAPEDPVEIRRLVLTNDTDRPRSLHITSYGEVVLNQQATDTRHPAFNKLFIEEEWVEERNLQIFKRRQRSESETPVFMGHLLLVSDEMTPTRAHEADRACFIGRGRSIQRPAVFETSTFLSGSSGATLDPIFALGQTVILPPHGTTRLTYLTLAAESREAILALAGRYQSWTLIDQSFLQADMNTQAWLGQNNINSEAIKNISQVLSALIYPFPATRTTAVEISANRLGQSGLWRFGVSGDYPIMLVEVEDPGQLDLVREVLQTHRFLRSRRFMADLIIINKQNTDYGAELNGLIYRLISRVNSEQWLNQRGGIFILYEDKMQAEERTLLHTAARVILSGAKGSLADQLPGYSIRVAHLPDLTPTHEPVPEPGTESSLPSEPLQFSNGYGGFSSDGREYVMNLSKGKTTPAPWINVIGYSQFGFLVTESGSQCTWAINSGENRLSPWSNDPVCDPTGEALYLRDEETGEVWTPTPLPSGENVSFRVRHGAGYTVFEHESHGLNQRLTLFASPEDPVKLIHLEVQNTQDQIRRITATEYIDWVLGTTHFNSQPYLIPEYSAERECLLVTNPYNTEFAERVAFLASSHPVHGVTTDRTEFLGRNGTLARPLAFQRIGLETRITAGEDTCGVLQVHLDLPPGGKEEVYFFLGEGNTREHALALVDKYHEGGCVGAAWERTHTFWDRLLDTVQVQTPVPAADLILNRWLLYQALSCRIWGRTAFYQSSGAFGFRDQLQDVLAVLPVDPAITRAQILNAAYHQFEEGDVLHWWHPPSGRGVRTRISDDLLWLPYVTALYVEATGDWSILAEKVPFLHGDVLKEGEDERYGLYQLTTERFTIFEHCRRAIEKGATTGAHRLPLIGTGDWNDGYNRVGVQGKGESVWLAWFICDVFGRFADLCDQAQTASIADELKISPDQAANYRMRAKEYAAAVEASAWDGAWYRRAYYDDGKPLGSKEDEECKIDGIAQSWAVISGAGDAERAKQAMQSTLDNLVQPKERLSLLFTPPFDQTPQDPGYIKGYLPGTRENGGQYTHAATWTAWAFTQLGEGRQSGALFDLLNPVLQAENETMANTYRVEPYVICADIYSVEPYLRRGGWTWYTGSAAWMYRLGLEAILGFRRVGAQLCIDPVIPPEWQGFKITYRFGEAIYQIEVQNPNHQSRGVKQITVDGNRVTGNAFPLVNDGRLHPVIVEMGTLHE